MASFTDICYTCFLTFSNVSLTFELDFSADATNHSSQKASGSKETDDTYKGDVKDVKFSSRKPGNDNIQLKGKNTFAVPRNVKPLGFTANKLKAEEGDEKPKSNEEFRKMFIR